MTPSRPLADPQADRIATLERELAEMLRDWTEDVNKCERAERELAAVTAERDALKAGKWAGPWAMQYGKPLSWARASTTCDWGAAGVGDVRDGFTWRASDGKRNNWDHYERIAPTLESAKAAADAALLAAGWYLAPTPPTGTPGDGTR